MKNLVLYIKLLKTANRKQQNTDSCLSLDANCDIMFLILSELNTGEPMTSCETRGVRLIGLLTLFLCLCCHYTNNEKHGEQDCYDSRITHHISGFTQDQYTMKTFLSL